jgi:hypothetical protein
VTLAHQQLPRPPTTCQTASTKMNSNDSSTILPGRYLLDIRLSIYIDFQPFHLIISQPLFALPPHRSDLDSLKLPVFAVAPRDGVSISLSSHTHRKHGKRHPSIHPFIHAFIHPMYSFIYFFTLSPILTSHLAFGRY